MSDVRKRLQEIVRWVSEYDFRRAETLDILLGELEADAVARQAMLKGLTVEEGAAVLELDNPREIVIAWVWAAREMLGDAPNYVEGTVDFPRESASTEVKAAGEIDRYVFTVQRKGKLTPHEARVKAETELAEMRGRAEQLLATWKHHPDGTISRVCRTILGLPKEGTDD